MSSLDKFGVKIIDNDEAFVKIKTKNTNIISLDEKYSNGYANISLSTQPKSDVTITFSPSDDQFTVYNGGIGQSVDYIFTPENWMLKQRRS